MNNGPTRLYEKINLTLVDVTCRPVVHIKYDKKIIMKTMTNFSKESYAFFLAVIALVASHIQPVLTSSFDSDGNRLVQKNTERVVASQSPFISSHSSSTLSLHPYFLTSTLNDELLQLMQSLLLILCLWPILRASHFIKLSLFPHDYPHPMPLFLHPTISPLMPHPTLMSHTPFTKITHRLHPLPQRSALHLIYPVIYP